MKTKINYRSMIVLAILGMGFGSVDAQSQPGKVSLNVQQLSASKWNTPDGIPYRAVPGFNFGAISFEVLGGNQVAFLCNASNEVIITDEAKGTVLTRFPVPPAPRDFVYDNGFFYVLNAHLVSVYDAKGNLSRTISFPAAYTGVERLTRFDKGTYLLLPDGNCLKIESDGNSMEAKEYPGWITAAGFSVITKLSGSNSYSFAVITSDGKRFEKSVTTNGRTAGVYVVGATASRIYLDVQTFVSESPIRVQRNIVSLELRPAGIGEMLAGIQVPDCYYVLSNNDFHVASNGSILNMVTAPQGLYVYALTELQTKDAKGYPDFLKTLNYHFNDHLMQVDAK
jgi:hypothetical protein